MKHRSKDVTSKKSNRKHDLWNNRIEAGGESQEEAEEMLGPVSSKIKSVSKLKYDEKPFEHWGLTSNEVRKNNGKERPRPL